MKREMLKLVCGALREIGAGRFGALGFIGFRVDLGLLIVGYEVHEQDTETYASAFR